MDFRATTQEDLDYVRNNPFEGAVKNYPDIPVPKEDCYTTIFQGSIVAVGGVTVLWKGVGEVWLMLTADCKKDGLFGVVALEAIRNKMEEITRNLRRVQAIVRTDFPEAIRMIEAFGFEREGLLRQYCPDKGDAYIYAKIRRPNGHDG